MQQISANLRQTIIELACREDVRSVSCPFEDHDLWHRLVEEQVKRANQLQLPLQRAYCLSGPESGLDGLTISEWGGDVHIPYEGVCDGDLLILPEWRRFSPDRLRGDGNLRPAIAKCCNHLIVRGDYGELGNVSRRVIDDWVLYSSNRPPTDCNPFFGDT